MSNQSAEFDYKPKALAKQLASLIEGARSFKAEHGACRVTVGPNSPIAKAGIERVSGFWIEVEHDLRLVSRDPDVEDIVVDGSLVYYRAVEESGYTAKDILGAVGWLDSFGSGIEFNSADWSGDSTVHLEGRADNLLVDATFILATFNVQRDWDSDWEDDDDD